MLSDFLAQRGVGKNNNVASAMFRFATSGNFTSNLAGENASYMLKRSSTVNQRDLK